MDARSRTRKEFDNDSHVVTSLRAFKIADSITYTYTPTQN